VPTNGIVTEVALNCLLDGNTKHLSSFREIFLSCIKLLKSGS
jgi:hypothetical protein